MSRSGSGARLSAGGAGADCLDFNEPSDCRRRHRASVLLLNLGLPLLLLLVVSVSLGWTMSIASSSRAGIRRSYRRLREQLVSDLSVIGELSRPAAKPHELEFCSSADEKSLGRRRRNGSVCLVAPPPNYRIPLRWPTGRDFIWKNNVKVAGEEFSQGSLTKRMMVEEEHISFRSDSFMADGVEDYAHQIAEMIGLRNESMFVGAGIRIVLVVECGVGSFGAHLSSQQLLTLCVAGDEVSGSQVQLTLERGLPTIVGSFASEHLPLPALSFDMIHCAQCGIDWDSKDGVFMLEIDRLLRPGGFFVWNSEKNQKKRSSVHDFAESICWSLVAQQDETVVWRKTTKKSCYSSRKSGPAICGKNLDPESPYYEQLRPCIGGTRNRRWILVENRAAWPSRSKLSSAEFSAYGVLEDEFSDDMMNWRSAVQNYWSLLSPLIFSDHPKRPGEDDPSAPSNMLRNVLDMNARFGGFNAALLDAGKSVWVMNVVPVNGANHLPLILDRGFIGIQHDWCEAFPTYPRTYDMVHADGLLSLEARRKHNCSLIRLFAEIDRILRPEGWIILRDAAAFIEDARSVTARMKWDARMMEMDAAGDERLLLCQKPFLKRLQQP